MSAVSERIGALVKASGLSNRELARRLGTTHVTISNWLNGASEPNESGLEKLCEFFEVTPAYIKYGDGNAPMGQTIISDDVVSIPLINAEVSCGQGFLNDSELVLIRFVRVSIELIRRYCPTANLRSLQIMTAFGDSMEPTLSEGDSVIVDVSEKTVRRDGMYVVRIGDGLFVKRVQIIPKGAPPPFRQRVLQAYRHHRRGHLHRWPRLRWPMFKAPLTPTPFTTRAGPTPGFFASLFRQFLT